MPAFDTDVDICNEALAATNMRPITALTDATEPARRVAFFYDKMRRQLLEECDWKFASKTIRLNLIGQAAGFSDIADFSNSSDDDDDDDSSNVTEDNDIFPWAYLYSYPPKCRFLHDVYSEQNFMGFPEGWLGYGSLPSLNPTLIGVKQWDLVQSRKTNEYSIACNIQNALARYTFDVTDTSQFSQSFCTALSLKIAQKICIPLTGDKELKNDIDEDLKNAMSDAARLNLSEFPEYGPRSSSYENERGM